MLSGLKDVRAPPHAVGMSIISIIAMAAGIISAGAVAIAVSGFDNGYGRRRNGPKDLGRKKNEGILLSLAMSLILYINV